MDIGAQNLLFAVKLVIWLVLLFFAFKLRLVRTYPVVFLYVLVAIASEITIAVTAWILGALSLGYAYVHLAASLVTLGLAGLVLLRIYFLLQRACIARDWHLVVVFAAAVCVAIWDRRDLWVIYRVLIAGYLSVSYVGLVTLLRMRRRRFVVLGWNLKMVLLALTLPATFYSLVLAGYLLGVNVSRESAGIWLSGVGVASWVILAVGMSEYSPPVFLNAREGEEGGSDDPNEDDDQSTQRMEANRTCSI